MDLPHLPIKAKTSGMSRILLNKYYWWLHNFHKSKEKHIESRRTQYTLGKHPCASVRFWDKEVKRSWQKRVLGDK